MFGTRRLVAFYSILAYLKILVFLARKVQMSHFLERTNSNNIQHSTENIPEIKIVKHFC